MNAEGIEIFHRADGQNIASAVAQHFEFDLLPAVDVFFDENLRDRREHQAVVRDGTQLLFMVRHAAAGAAERECGADDNGVADLVRDSNALLDRIRDVGRDDRLTDLLHRLLKEFPVLRTIDGVHLRADELDAPLIEKALLR